MPLSLATLEDALTGLSMDPGENPAACAAAWADAIGSYAADVLPASSVEVAASTLETALASAFATVGGAIALMEPAFTAFGAAVGTGMAPAFVATPPAGPVGFAGLVGGAPPPDDATFAAAWAAAIDTWMRTGTAVPSGGGPAVNWN